MDENNLPVEPSLGWITSRSKDFVFWTSVVYTVIAVIVAGIFQIPQIEDWSSNFGVPLSVAWFGAVGAITISLQGVFQYRNDWDSTYNFWHFGRPLIGAIVGVMSFLILSVIVAMAGGSVGPESPPPEIANMNIFHVLAFIVGYREETFRDLLKRVTDLILQPGKASETVD